jgi:oligoendopeptidase F
MKRILSRAVFTVTLIAFMAAIPVSIVFADESTLPQRADIDAKYKWSLEDIYPTVDDWNADYNYLESRVNEIEQFKGKLGESAEALYSCLSLQDSLNIILGRLFVYAYMKQDEDTRVPEFQELGGKVAGINAQFEDIESYISPELLTIPDETLMGFVDSYDKLEPYRFFFEDLIRSKKHVLGDKEERIMALAGTHKDNIKNVFRMLYNADVKFPKITDENGEEIQLSRQRFSKIMESPDREVRKEAHQKYNEAYQKYFNTFGAILNSTASHHWFDAQARNYNTCLEQALDDDNIPPEVVSNLVNAVNANLAPLHKWMSIRKRIMGLEELHGYDTSVPLVPEAKEEVEYDKAVEMVLKGVKPLGKAYGKDLKVGLSGGWIDVYETEGKRSGGYQWGSYSTHPYILMNYSDRLETVFTLAHETGHAMHSFYSKKSQPYRLSYYTLFVAEFASNINEALLMDDLLNKTKDKDKKMYLLNYYIENIIGTFYFQTLLTEFEMKVYEAVEKGEALSSESMKEMYREISQKYWGPELIIDEWGGWGGLRVPHYNTHNPYYVYKYATGFAAALAISSGILEGDEKARDNYLEFLTWGGNDYPVEQLKKIGVDMTKPDVINAAIARFSELVDEMEKLLDES